MINKIEEYYAIMLGDITGHYGRLAVKNYLPQIIDQYNPVIVIANAENICNSGYGIDRDSFYFLIDHGINVVTLGNHVRAHEDYAELINNNRNLIAPANLIFHQQEIIQHYGYFIHKIPNINLNIGVINLIGNDGMNIFSDNLFYKAENIVNLLKDQCNAIFIDIHAENNEEKYLLGTYLSGRVTAVCGTHWHIPTADTRILNNCTGYQTDIGMCGNYYWNKNTKSINKLFKRYVPWNQKSFSCNMEKKADSSLCGVLIKFNNHGICLDIKSFVKSENIMPQLNNV